MNEYEFIEEARDPYEGLAYAVILQAVEDYRRSCRVLATGRRRAWAVEMRKECLEFFQSEWFELLTDLNPELLISRLDRETAKIKYKTAGQEVLKYA